MACFLGDWRSQLRWEIAAASRYGEGPVKPLRPILMPIQARPIAPTTQRVIRWTASGATLGALGGGSFGMALAALVALLRLEPWRFVATAGYLTFCGAAA